MFLASGDTEIDMVVLNADERRMRFATCTRDATRLADPIDSPQRAGNVFVATHHRCAAWQVEWVGIAPTVPCAARKVLVTAGVAAEAVDELTDDL